MLSGIEEGMPLSLDNKGYAFPGAGTTIYRNVSIDTIDREMKNVKIRELVFNVAMVVYDGGIDAMMFQMDGYAMDTTHDTLKPTLNGNEREVSDVFRVSRERFIVVGSGELLPVTARVELQDRRLVVNFYQGTPLALDNDDDRWPHADSLDNDTFALIYENGYYLYTRVGHWTGEGTEASLTLDSEQLATLRYEYHGVAGMDNRHFVIAATGRQYMVNSSMPTVRACLCTILDDNTIEFGTWKALDFTFSHNFFAMDNMGPDEIIMTFAEDSGVTAVVLRFDRTDNDIYFGSHEMIQTGGAILRENRLDLRVLNFDQFGVFYEDDAIQSLCFVICEISSSHDIEVVSPTYIISRAEGQRFTNFYFDLCEIGAGNFAIVEYRDSGRDKTVLIHRGEIKPRPVGIATSVKTGSLKIQFAGIFKVSGQQFTPGRAIYTNTKGELIEGSPFGYANSEFGSYYVFSPIDNSILSSTSLVGIAVTKNKVYMKIQ